MTTQCTDTPTLEQSVVPMSTTAEKACDGIMQIIKGTWATGPDYDTRLVVDTLRTIYELAADAQMAINKAATAVGCQHDANEAFKPSADADEEAAVLQHAASHFAAENELMRTTAFPPRDCHISEHEAVLSTLRGVRARLARGEVEGARRVADELATCFPPHVQHLDSALTHWPCKLQHGAKPVVLRVGRKPEAALAC